MAQQELSPPVSGSDVTAGAEALAKAICWLSSTVQEERAARLFLETRVATIGIPANAEQDAPSASASTSSVLTPEELQGLRDSITTQVRESILAELAVSKDAMQPVQQSSATEMKSAIRDKSQEQKDPSIQALMERLNMLDDRVNGIGAHVNYAPSFADRGLQPSPVASRELMPSSESMPNGIVTASVNEMQDEISRRLSTLEASVQELLLKLEAVGVLPSASPSTEQASRAMITRSRSGSKTAPQYAEELRSELMKFMEVQIASLKDTLKEGADDPHVEDVVAASVGRLRLELTSLLHNQLDSLRAQVSEAEVSPSASSPTSREVTDAVSKAVADLRDEVGTWLEEQLSSYQVAPVPGRRFSSEARQLEPIPAHEDTQQVSPATVQTETPQVTAAATQTNISSTQAESVQTSGATTGTDAPPVPSEAVPSQESSSRPGPTAASQAVSQIRTEIFNWLEDQLTNLREELARNAEKQAASLAPSISVAPPAESVQEQKTENTRAASRRPSSARSKSTNDDKDEDSVTFAPTVVPESLYGSLEDVVKFFQGELDDIRNMLVTGRADAMKKASNALRKEVRGWVDQELIEMQMKLKSGLQATDEIDRGIASSPLPTLKEASPSEEWLSSHLPEMMSKLCSDEHFNSFISQRCKEELSSVFSRPASRDHIAAELDGVIESKEMQKLPSRTSVSTGSFVGVLGSGGTTIAKLESRLSGLERQVARELEERKPSKQISLVPAQQDHASNQGDTSTTDHPPDLLSLMQVHDDLRRLKTRFEYLERMAPPEVQKALSFFEPLREEGAQTHDAHHQGSQASQLVGNAALMRRLHDLQASQDSELDEAKQNSEEAKREVANLSRALRGVQRDGEVHGSKLLDIQKSLAEQQKRLEVALPQLLQSLEELLGAGRQAGSEPDVAEGLRELLLPGGDSSKAPFVSQSSLRQALDALQGEVQAWLSKLREDIQNVLRNKADTDLVRSIMGRLEQVQSSSAMLQVPDQGNDAAVVRVPLTQGRCVSCDAQIGMRFEEPTNWPKQKQKPSPPWPQRGQHIPPSVAPVGSIRPLPTWPVVAGPQMTNAGDSDTRSKPTRPISGTTSGGNVRRVESLPAITPSTTNS